MTYDETKSVLAYLAAVYREMTVNRDARQMTAVWADIFQDDDVRLVTAAAKAYVSTSKFAPTPADIREKMAQLAEARDMSEMEAWNLVSGAARNGYYSAQQEWEKLPEDIRKIVTPQQLRMWSAMDSAQFETVVQSNFMRSYKALKQDAKWQRALPNALKQALPGTGQTALPG